MKHEKRERSISALCALILLVVFAAGVVTVLLGGVRVYQQLDGRSQVSADRRNAALYLTTKVRQSGGSVIPGSFCSREALLLTETHGDTTYITRIYCYDGWLWELFAPADGDFSPEDGEKVLPLKDLRAEQADGMLILHLADPDGGTRVLRLSVKQREEAKP